MANLDMCITSVKCCSMRTLCCAAQNKMIEAGQASITADMLSSALLGQRCWVRWPYLQEAEVQGVSDKTQKVIFWPLDLAPSMVCTPSISPVKLWARHRMTSQAGRKCSSGCPAINVVPASF